MFTLFCHLMSSNPSTSSHKSPSDALPGCHSVFQPSARLIDAVLSSSWIASHSYVPLCRRYWSKSETLTLSVPRIERVSSALAAVLHVPELRHRSAREPKHLHLALASVVLHGWTGDCGRTYGKHDSIRNQSLEGYTHVGGFECSRCAGVSRCPDVLGFRNVLDQMRRQHGRRRLFQIADVVDEAGPVG